MMADMPDDLIDGHARLECPRKKRPELPPATAVSPSVRNREADGHDAGERSERELGSRPLRIRHRPVRISRDGWTLLVLAFGAHQT